MKQRSWLAILLSFAGPCRGKLVLSVICAIISVAGGFVPYLGVYEILRLFIHQSASGTELLRWAGVCLAGYAVKVAFYAFSTMLAHVSAYTILEGLRRQVAHKLMHAPLGSVLSKPVGSLKSTIVDRIEDIEPPLAHMIPELSSNVLLPIVVVISLFAMDWRVGLASLATIPAALIPMAAGLRTYNEKYAAYMAANAQVNSIIVEYVEGIEVVKAFNQSGASYEKFVRAVTSFRDFTLDWFRCTWKSMNLCLSILPKLLKKGFAINSLESINNLVHPALELAVDDDYIRKNPSKGVYRSLKSEGSGKPAKTRIALTKEQQKNFLRFISKSPMYSHWLPVMVVLLGTGLRVGECTGLTKNDVDLENNTISVNHNLIYRVIDGKAGFHITTPKTASGTRTIPILYPEVAEQLRALIEVMDALYPEDLVMNGYHGFLFRNRSGYFLSAHNINRAIERISIAYNAEEMDQAELEDREPSLLPHFSVHNLRHTFCTRLCESTNDIKFIQQVMGHADFSTTMDIYTHITQENMKEKAEVIKGNLVLM